MGKLKEEGITLVALIITVIILLILAGVALNLTLGERGIFNIAKQAKEETIKNEALEKLKLKISTIQMEKYATTGNMPNLQEIADGLCEDEEIEYVKLPTEQVASIDKITLGNSKTILTKIKQYPYEFEIGNDLKIKKINGEKITDDNTQEENRGEYEIPTGTLEIKENGKYNVINFAEVNVQIATDKIHTKEEYEQYGTEQYNNGYSTGYTKGLTAWWNGEFEDGATSEWDYKAVEVQGSNIHGYVYECGYKPRYVFMKWNGLNGSDAMAWSFDGCSTFYLFVKGKDGSCSAQNFTNSIHGVSNGIELVNWTTETNYSLKIWTMK